METGKKILVVDNDRDIVESIKIVLIARGYRVVTAFSGEEGMRMVRSEMPDLVVLDVMMETIDKGYEVCDRIKTDPVTKHIPVILLTAIKELSDLDYSLRAEETPMDMDDPAPQTGPRAAADMIFEKPIRPEDLLEKVGILLGR
jgi:CheY-like chemotaxis protein